LDINAIKQKKTISAPIYVVSCGEGITGEQLVESALVQFPQNEVTVIKVSHMRNEDQIEKVVDNASTAGGMIVHTLIDPVLRRTLNELGRQRGVVTIDLMGPILSSLTDSIGQKPICQPGLYRQIHQVDLDQVAAIEFSIAHDDGMNPHTLSQAEIVLVGVSRAGKTPLSMYLAVLGWKVANVPLVMGIPLPEELFQIDRSRVIALNINTDQLLAHRQMRQRRMGNLGNSSYNCRNKIYEEVEYARKLFRQKGFHRIEVTNKPIETSADEIIELITRKFKDKVHKR